MFNAAWELENSLQYQPAIETYEQIIKDYPESDEAKLCPDRILFCEGMLDQDWSKQRDYFLAVADTSNVEDLRLMLRSSAAWCLVELGQEDSASAEYLALMDSTSEEYETYVFELQRMFAELHATGIDTIFTGNKTAGSADRLSRILARAEQMLTADKPNPQAVTHVPTRFALYQNYPNPFNPITEIRFELPEATGVELKIFNTLGQLVTTLVSETRPAGAYTVKWDGKNSSGLPVSTGMYVYQIKAGKFSDAKKMLLLR
jgi:hypothetical protein